MKKLVTKIYLLSIMFLISQYGFANVKQTILPLKFSQDLPSITITIQGKVIPLIFDVGAHKDGIVLNEELLKTIKTKPMHKEICSHDDTGKKICL